jgi:hypothetical protein
MIVSRSLRVWITEWEKTWNMQRWKLRNSLIVILIKSHRSRRILTRRTVEVARGRYKLGSRMQQLSHRFTLNRWALIKQLDSIMRSSPTSLEVSPFIRLFRQPARRSFSPWIRLTVINQLPFLTINRPWSDSLKCRISSYTSPQRRARRPSTLTIVWLEG